MSSFSRIPGGNFSTAKPGTGTKALMVMGGLAMGFVGFYAYLDRKDRARLSRGDLHGYEHSLIHPKNTASGLASTAETAPRATVHVHDAHHVTRGSPEAGSLYMQPSPQRAKSDGSGHAYTKSPDFARSYGKTDSHRDDSHGKM